MTHTKKIIQELEHSKQHGGQVMAGYRLETLKELLTKIEKGN